MPKLKKCLNTQPSQTIFVSESVRQCPDMVNQLKGKSGVGNIFVGDLIMCKIKTVQCAS